MILDKIVEDKKKRLIQQKQEVSEDKMKSMALESTRESISFMEAMAKKGLSIIGEFKNASPSHGKMNQKMNVTDRIRQYNSSMDAISCLTEEDHFQGSIEYFKEIRSISNLPMIRKDFIIDPYQVYESKIIGADCILLIAAILQDNELKMLYELAYLLGMDVLVEVHDEEEMRRAIELEAKMIGVNNRNLNDFSVDLHVTKRLSRLIPEETLLVSESGISNDDDIIFLKKCRVNALLIGTVFMETEYPEKLALKWKDIFTNNML